MVKIVNAIEKGRRNERKCVVFLQENGWKTMRTHRSRFGPNDYWSDSTFGGFDVSARKKGIVRWIQCKSNVIPKKTREQMQEWVEEYSNPCETYEIWCWVDKESWKKILFHDENIDLEYLKPLIPDFFEDNLLLE